MKELHNLDNKAYDAIKELLRRGDLKPSDWELANYITGTMKNIGKIMGSEGGYSKDGYSSAGTWRANMEGDYSNGSSYRRRRDSMGRYSSDGNGYSQDDGYTRNSYHGDDTMEILQEMMRKADPKEKEVIRRCIEEMQK